MIQLADRILVQALSRQASDIHIEPQEDGLHVRLRLDGVLQAIQVHKDGHWPLLHALLLLLRQLMHLRLLCQLMRRRLSNRRSSDASRIPFL